MQKDTTIKIRTGEELDQNILEKYFSEQIPGFVKITGITQFPGGFSNLTYLISYQLSAFSLQPSEEKLSADSLLKLIADSFFVLRRPPFGNYVKSGHDMSREFRVLTLLKKAGYVCVPEPILFEETGNIIGVPFYIMERLDGIILRAKDAQNPALTPEIMRSLSEKMIDNLVHLHSLNIETTGLNTLGKPENYVQRQVSGWIKRYEQSQTDGIADMKTIADWMTNFSPRPQAPTFLHNDYKFDNVVFSGQLSTISLQPSEKKLIADSLKLIAVLDWEMSTVGDPLMDLGAALAYWCEKTDAPFTKQFNLTWIDGCLTRQEVIDRYAQKTGRDLTDIPFYYVFGLFKNAVIMQQIYSRWKSGATNDPRFAGLIAGVYELSKMGVKAISYQV